MKFLIVGDIVGKSGMDKVCSKIPAYIKNENIDFIIVNGENSANGKGLRMLEYEKLVSLGVDVITMGNHIYYRKEMHEMYAKLKGLLIPANITNLVGRNYEVVEKNGYKVGVLNLIGKVNITEIKDENSVSPFDKADEIINEMKQKGVDYIFVDFHAEATAEKIAMGYFLNTLGVTCMFGTHTHVQTADERIIDGKMAYITDVGMTGPKDSVLGLKKDIALKRFVNSEKLKYECSENDAMFNAIVIETDDNLKIAKSIKRINE